MQGREASGDTSGEIPHHLRRPPRLMLREGGRLVEAPPEDQALARGYAQWREKGPVTEGRRLTIMTRKREFTTDEEVRVLHVLEVPQPGQEVWVMGPKQVYGEFVDGRLATAPPPETDAPWEPEFYDGAVEPSPAADFNYDITTYRFSEPGTHRIQWKLGKLHSNELSIEVTDAQR